MGTRGVWRKDKIPDHTRRPFWGEGRCIQDVSSGIDESTVGVLDMSRSLFMSLEYLYYRAELVTYRYPFSISYCNRDFSFGDKWQLPPEISLFSPITTNPFAIQNSNPSTTRPASMFLFLAPLKDVLLLHHTQGSIALWAALLGGDIWPTCTGSACPVIHCCKLFLSRHRVRPGIPQCCN